MSGITKSIKFAAPYRSKTFNDATNLITGLNGVVSGGAVTTSLSTVTIQPLVFVQNGLVVISAVSLSATLPAGLTAPYFVAVSASSSIENPAEVITPTFVKRPRDVGQNTVLVAEYDGQEWRALPKIQFRELIINDQISAIKEDLIGILNGMDVSIDGGNIVVDSGSVRDRQGRLSIKADPVTLPIVGTDVSGWDRIDQVVFRRPADDSARVGTTQYLVGQTFDPSGADATLFDNLTQIGDTGKVNAAAKVLNVASSNTSLFLYKEGYGALSNLVLRSAPNALTPVAAAVDIASNFTGFDAILNPNGQIDLVYTRAGNLYYKRVTTAGVDVFTETALITGVATLANPKLVSVKSGSGFFLHIVVEKTVSGAVHDLMYVRLSSANTIETTPVTLVSLSANITNPSLEKDDDDALLLLAYENFSTGRVYLRQYDASTATSGTAPTLIGTTLELEDDTYRISTASTLGISTSSNPVVVRAANKETYVFWRQDKGSGVFGVAVYNQKYLTDFGHKAVMQDLFSSAEDISLFAVTLDALICAHFHAVDNQSSNSKKMSLRLETADTIGNVGVVSASAPDTINIGLNAKGALIHTFGFDSASFSANGTPLDILFMGPGVYLGQAVSSNQFVVRKDFGANFYDGLPTAPTVGDNIVVTLSSPNDGTYNFVSVSSFVDSGNNYDIVTTDGTFTLLNPGGSAQFQTQDGSTTSFIKSTAGILFNLRGFTVAYTDVFIAHYRTSDGILAVSGVAIEESTPVSRLYEFFNCFAGGGGTVSWQIAGVNQLAFNSDIILRFFNRLSTYTVTAIPGGITVGPDQVAYVNIGDTDEPEALTLKVDDFGNGVLDRYGKGAYPLFWNIGGVLFTRFAPYRLSASGETVLLGDQLSQQMLEWLAGPGFTSTPDPSNHGYTHTSASGLLQSDDIITAISKLDAGIAALISGPEEEIAVVGAGGITTYTAASVMWDPSNAFNDVMVFINGVKNNIDPTGGLSNDYRKNSATQLEWSYTLPQFTVITLDTGNISGGGGTLAVKEDGSMVDPAVQSIDFQGAGVTVSPAGPGAVIVTIPGAGGGALNIQKIVKNNSGTTIAAKKVVAWQDDGTVAQADQTMSTLSDFAGITVASLPDLTFGAVYKSGNVPGALVGLGATPGQEVFMDNAGGFTLTPTANPGDTVFKLGRAEPPTGVATATADDLYLELEVIIEP